MPIIDRRFEEGKTDVGEPADDVVALCAELGLDRPTLLGHSAGGFVALHAALRRGEITIPALVVSCGVTDQAGGRGRNGTCSSRPLPTTSAVPAGISCQSPGSGASGSETTTRESAAKWANRSFSG